MDFSDSLAVYDKVDLCNQLNDFFFKKAMVIKCQYHLLTFVLDGLDSVLLTSFKRHLL